MGSININVRGHQRERWNEGEFLTRHGYANIPGQKGSFDLAPDFACGLKGPQDGSTSAARLSMAKRAAAYGACLVFAAYPGLPTGARLFRARGAGFLARLVFVELPLFRIVDGAGQVAFEVFGAVGRGEGGVG